MGAPRRYEVNTRYREITRDYILHVLAIKRWKKAELARATSIAASTFTRTLTDKYKTQLDPQTLFKVAEVSGIPLPRELASWVDLSDIYQNGQDQGVVMADNPKTPRELFTFDRDVPLYSLLPSEQSSGLYQPLARGYTERPKHLAGIEGVKALIVPDDTMNPVFSINHIVETNPAKKPVPGDDVVVGFDCGAVTIRRFVRKDDRELTVEQFNPPVRQHYPCEKVVSCEPIAFVIRP